MLDEDIIVIGEYCEDLLQQNVFKVLVDEFDKQCFSHFMATDAKDKMERESVYQQWRGAKDFLDHLTAFVTQKDETLKRNAALSEDAQHIPGID